MYVFIFLQRKKVRKVILNSQVRKKRMVKRTGQKEKKEYNHIALTREHQKTVNRLIEVYKIPK